MRTTRSVRTLGRIAPLLAFSAAVVLTGCYSMRPSQGGGQTTFQPPREIATKDIALPEGYRIEAVAKDLTFPSAVVMDDRNRVYVVEAGYSYGEAFTVPRLLRVENDGTVTEIARGSAGPWTGASFHGGRFYIAESGTPGRIVEISADGTARVVVDNLPPRTDHFTTRPVVGPDGWLYFGQGSATNSAVVGEDNLTMGWLKREPKAHDVPCRDITLAGENFETRDLLTPESREKVKTGAYVPFGTSTRNGEVIRGRVPCTSAVMRTPLAGGPVELVAWGLRHPFGMAFGPNGRLYVTDNSYDERGSRPIFGSGDYLWLIEPGAWYGWPDFAGGEPVNTDRFTPPGKPTPKLLLAHRPNTPPKPVAALGVHSSANGFDFSRNPAFGHAGDAFIALFGDMAANTGKVLFPVGFKIVRVNPVTGVIEEFLANKGKVNGPASLLKTGGLERPIDVRFDNSGTALYVVDFGVLTMAGKKAQPRSGTGVLWRVTRAAS